MQFQFVVTPETLPPVGPPPQTVSETADLLRQILEVQREQLALQKAAAVAHDQAARWRAFLARWQGEFPELGESCRRVLPALERSYGALLTELSEHLRRDGAETLDNEFALADFLDRYGMRLSQLGTILSLVAILGEAAGQSGEASS
jgi:hypothetical protein